MSKYFVIVAGNGATSRANIEALMEDYYYAGGDGGTLLLPYTEHMTTFHHPVLY